AAPMVALGTTLAGIAVAAVLIYGGGHPGPNAKNPFVVQQATGGTPTVAPPAVSSRSVGPPVTPTTPAPTTTPSASPTVSPTVSPSASPTVSATPTLPVPSTIVPAPTASPAQ